MREISYRDALREALAEEMERDSRVFLIGEDIGDPFGGSFKVTSGLMTQFGEARVRNAPLSEIAIAGSSLGAAMTGLIPVAEIMYIDFSACCMDQIVNQIAKVRYMSGGQIQAPLVIRTQQGTGRASAAQHAQSWESIFSHIPGLKVALPSTPKDAKGMLKAAIRDPDPVIFIEHKLLYNEVGPVPEEEYIIPLGQAEIKREGKDVTLVATSRMVHFALAAAEEMAADGVDVEVIDPRTTVPLDKAAILESLKKTKRLVIAHEAIERCGWGAELAALMVDEAFDYLDAPIIRVAAKNTPVPFAPHLEASIVPNVEDIVAGINRTL